LVSNFVFDARFLANPHYDPALRSLTGLDEPVIQFLEREDDASLFVESIVNFLKQWLPRFSQEGRAAVTVAIGCTGGQHRSVFVAERVASALMQQGLASKQTLAVRVRHRDAKLQA
jgi:RNase adapter protein RapZ